MPASRAKRRRIVGKLCLAAGMGVAGVTAGEHDGVVSAKVRYTQREFNLSALREARPMEKTIAAKGPSKAADTRTKTEAKERGVAGERTGE